MFITENAIVFIEEKYFLSFKEAIKSALTKYAIPEGRACRSEFWFFALLNLLVLTFLFAIIIYTNFTFLWVLIPLYGLIALVPSISVLIRRLHDVGHSGWVYLLMLIPITGVIAIFVWLCSDSQPGSNKYGLNPKDNAGDENQARVSIGKFQG